MTRLSILLAGLLLGMSAAAAAQNAAQPANVVTPAPPPREGTVGPEQLRDFALPGTRQASPPPAEAPPSVPAPAPRATAPATTAPAPVRAQPRAEAPPPITERPPVAAERRESREVVASSLAQSMAVTPAQPQALPVPLPPTGDPLPPITVTQSETQATSLLPGWWPWLLVAVLGGIGLALALRQRRKPALAGSQSDAFERRSVEPALPPAAEPASAPPPSPPPAPAPTLPTGLVTTRLRSPAPPEPAPPPQVTGGIVSRRLRGWVEIELVVREILFDANEALFRVDLVLANSGTTAARDIALEVVTTNAGEQQAAELAGFFARPAAAMTAVRELGPLSDTVISYELRMPRGAIRAYEAQGRALFVPVVALTATYRIASGEGRTGAAFLVGRDVPGSEKLAPLVLPEGPGRLLGLGVRRLEEAVRR